MNLLRCRINRFKKKIETFKKIEKESFPSNNLNQEVVVKRVSLDGNVQHDTQVYIVNTPQSTEHMAFTPSTDSQTVLHIQKGNPKLFGYNGLTFETLCYIMV